MESTAPSYELLDVQYFVLTIVMVNKTHLRIEMRPVTQFLIKEDANKNHFYRFIIDMELKRTRKLIRCIFRIRTKSRMLENNPVDHDKNSGHEKYKRMYKSGPLNKHCK